MPALRLVDQAHSIRLDCREKYARALVVRLATIKSRCTAIISP